ncbi:pentatricopeptide repeat-containing protein At5g13270, chloroplastic [Malania oleifera]|uniref:pentatricopeptide repeat-containing protein At5g13270, chloroplastic n=1 Tax=Malania oleifera TaxID=397392 RepID=UPI0025ADA2E4|nr:pentatricopeptide repeat-containing protein At5g13270, chloroplastic [Malania oleifera]
MASIPVPPSNPSQGLPHEKIQTIKTAKFAQIPSWVSLKNTSSVKTHPDQRGRLENLHLVSLSKQENLKEAHEYLQEMEAADVFISPHSYHCLFETCGKLKYLSFGRSIHGILRRGVKNPSVFLDNSVLQMYVDCESFGDAHELFDEMRSKSSMSWFIIISAYAQRGLISKAFGMFTRMQVSGIRPNLSIYVSLLSLLVKFSLLEIGKQIHSHVIRTGSSTDVLVNTAISNMYVKCGWLEGAKLVFDQMADKNAVTWTGLMVGYTQAEKQEDALGLFGRMICEGVELDEFVFSIVLKACSGLEDLEMGRQIHGYVVKLGLDSEASVGTPLADFYVKCQSFESAFRAFGRISEPNDVSWSALISGYSQIGEFEECIKIFNSLRNEGVVLNRFIYTSIFQACSALADLNTGAQAHGDAIKRSLISYLHGESAIITMYSKCGRLDYAYRAFESLEKPDTVAWTAIISGCAYHGNALEALRLFKKMQASGVRPNAVTFVAVLTACSHSGLVMEAKQFLDSMSCEYGVNPTIDHYDCMVDIYSRAGHLQEAFELINIMPFEADAMTWKCLLGGCCIHRNLELAKIAAKNLLQLDPNDAAGYILMFNLYASFGKWEEAANYRRMMAERNLRKEVSCSWISIKGKAHRFIVGDKHHPQTREIYLKLKELSSNNQTTILTEDDVSDCLPERKGQLLDHSERLAIAFGLISTPSNAPIIIFKNLRACEDCHDFAKHVSMVTGREIVVRDSTRFHRFERGKCSCNDYW